MKISVSSLGNPLSSKTWSGTPYAICKQLDKDGYLETAIDSSIQNRYLRSVLYIISKIYYKNSLEITRGSIYRYFRSYNVYNRLKMTNSFAVLHMGTLDLPIYKKDNKKHFLFCDSTWNLWQQFRKKTNCCSHKLFSDAEELEKQSYRQMTHIFPISEYVRDNLINHYGIKPNRITTVGTGRGNIKSFMGKKDYKNGPILFVSKGNFEDDGGRLLVDGFKIAQAQKPRLKLIIVGNEIARNIVGNTPNILVYGYVTWEKLQSFFNYAAIFAMPSFSEPWGLVYLEALSCKSPVLALNRNSIPEITKCGKYGFLVNEQIPVAISNAILDAYSNPKRLLIMGEEGQKYCLNKFKWQKTVKLIEETILHYFLKN
jgi:glycosyltransferase involved in cell wall biosynthesis